MKRVSVDKRMAYVLMILAMMDENKPGNFHHVHLIKTKMQRIASRTLRDEHIKSCLLDLKEKGWIESEPVTGVDVYKISSKGLEFWRAHGEGICQILSIELLNPDFEF